MNDKLSGNIITINGVGRFREDGQNTVFFDCDGTLLDKVWDKKDFPYNPHITLYDGLSQDFADKLEATIGHFDYNLDFISDRLQPMISIKGVPKSGIMLNYDPWSTYSITGEYVSNVELVELSMDRRLELIERICRHLAGISASRQGALGSSLVKEPIQAHHKSDSAD